MSAAVGKEFWQKHGMQQTHSISLCVYTLTMHRGCPNVSEHQFLCSDHNWALFQHLYFTSPYLFFLYFYHWLFLLLHPGSVYFVDDKGRSMPSFTAEGSVKFLLYSEGKDMIIAVTEGLILSQHRVAHDGTTSEIAKVRRQTTITFINHLTPGKAEGIHPYQ